MKTMQTLVREIEDVLHTYKYAQDISALATAERTAKAYKDAFEILCANIERINDEVNECHSAVLDKPVDANTISATANKNLMYEIMHEIADVKKYGDLPSTGE